MNSHPLIITQDKTRYLLGYAKEFHCLTGLASRNIWKSDHFISKDITDKIVSKGNMPFILLKSAIMVVIKAIKEKNKVKNTQECQSVCETCVFELSL